MSPRLYQAPQLRLRQLLSQAKFLHAEDIVFRGFECSPQRCGAEDLLVLLDETETPQPPPEECLPAHAVAGVLTPRELPRWHGPQCVVPDVWQALGQVAQAVAGWPARSLQLVGVWGSGLTGAAAQLIQRVLGTAGIATGLVGSAQEEDRLRGCRAAAKGIHSPQISQWLARIHEAGCTHAVIQVGEGQPPQRVLAGLELDVLCVTRVGQDLACAGRALEFLRPDGVLVVAAEQAAARELLDRWNGPALTVGLGTQWEVGATVLEEHPGEQTFLIHAGWESIPVRTRWLGTDYVRACLLATAVGLVHQFRLPEIARGLESLDGIPGCMEAVCAGQEFPLLVFWPEAAACRSVISSWRRVTPGTVFRFRWQPHGEPAELVAAGRDTPWVLPLPGSREARRTLRRWEELTAALCHVRPGDLVLLEPAAGVSQEEIAVLRRRLAHWLARNAAQRVAA